MASKNNSKLADEFMTEFMQAKREITKDLEELVEGEGLHQELDSLSQKIQNLTKKLHDSIGFLPAYTAKVRQNDLRALEELLKEKKMSMTPKPKFGFKLKGRVQTDEDILAKLESIAAKKLEDSIEKPNTSEPVNDSNFLTIQEDTIHGAVNNVITYEEDILNRIDVMVRNLEDKEIVLNGSPSTVHISNLKRCKVLCGPVQTSVFIDNCTSCTLFLCCQQLRTHSSTGLDIYLRVSSRAIIEDCSKIRFAPYTWTHPRSSEFHKMANIDEKSEKFDAVDDFNWLAFSTPSPNWSVLPKSERVAATDAEGK